MVRHTTLKAVVLLMAGSAMVTDLAAQTTTQPPRRPQPPAAQPAVRYDVSTVVSVKGTLVAIDTLASMSGMPGLGVHGTLKTATETMPVHFGPVIYLEKQKLRLVKGDAVTISGSRVILSTVPTILAASVVKGTDTLRLRDAAGMPLWRGMRMRAAR